MMRRRLASFATLMIATACVPSFEGERPRHLNVEDTDDRDAGERTPPRDAGLRPPTVDAGFIDAGARDGGVTPPRDAGPPPYTGPTFEDDVEPVLSAECLACHGNPTRFNAPMPLVTYADMMAPAPSDPNRPVFELVAQRVAPTPDNRIMPPAGALDGMQIQTVVRWALEGAPEGPRNPP